MDELYTVCIACQVCEKATTPDTAIHYAEEHEAATGHGRWTEHGIVPGPVRICCKKELEASVWIGPPVQPGRLAR